MFDQQQIPADRSAKPPTTDPYLTPGRQRPCSRSRTTTGSCCTRTGRRRRCTRRCRTSSRTCWPARTTPQDDGQGHPGRLGEVRQDAQVEQRVGVVDADATWHARIRPIRACRVGGAGRRGRAPGDPRNVGWLYVLPGPARSTCSSRSPRCCTRSTTRCSTGTA